jgi:hypothetical protein
MLFVEIPKGHFRLQTLQRENFKIVFFHSQNILIAYDAVLGLNRSRVLKTFATCLLSSQINYLR